MTARGVDIVTRWVVLGPFVLWAAWELVLVWLRARGWEVRLISQEARSIAARGLPSLAYAMMGLAAYLVADWLDPNRAYWPLVTQYLRHPTAAALIGGVGAWLMFPQRSIWIPGAP